MLPSFKSLIHTIGLVGYITHMSWLLQPLIITMTGPLSATGTGVTQLLTLRVYLYQGKLVMSWFIHTLKYLYLFP